MFVMNVVVALREGCDAPTKGDYRLLPWEKNGWVIGGIFFVWDVCTLSKRMKQWDWIVQNIETGAPKKWKLSFTDDVRKVFLLRVGAPLVGLYVGMMKRMENIADGLCWWRDGMLNLRRNVSLLDLLAKNGSPGKGFFSMNINRKCTKKDHFSRA